MPPTREFVILGAGNWGLTMACLLGKQGHSVRVWDHDADRALRTELERESRAYLPGTKLPITIGVGADLATLMEGAHTVLLALPVPAVRPVLTAYRPLFKPPVTILSLAKGIEYESGYRVSQLIKEILGGAFERSTAVLSGPNLAPEIVRESPAGAVVAGLDEGVCRQIQQDLSTPYFRLYTSSDIVGVEMGGALKNIIAIACGIVDELGMGANTRAAVMTRGLVEITRLGVAQGAEPMTFVGLSGMGDLMATCTSDLSRNHSVGRYVARGLTLEAIRDRMRMVAEGINTARAALKLSASLAVPMPITEEVSNVLFSGKEPRQAIRDLMTRELKRETEWSTRGARSAD